jgi:hypothetical protein
MIRQKQIIIKNKDKNWYKNQIIREKLKIKKTKTKYIGNQKIGDKIWYNQQITK